jgi:hypothetical protein
MLAVPLHGHLVKSLVSFGMRPWSLPLAFTVLCACNISSMIAFPLFPLVLALFAVGTCVGPSGSLRA